MKQHLVELGVTAKKMKVIRYGALIPELADRERKKYIYFGGHNILRGKEYVELLDALVILRQRGAPISIVIYVGYGCSGLAEAQKLAAQKGLADVIEWQDFYSGAELAEVYQRSKACIIHYTGGSARHPLTCAMVNATPVIATRAVDIPEYLGEMGSTWTEVRRPWLRRSLKWKRASTACVLSDSSSARRLCVNSITTELRKS